MIYVSGFWALVTAIIIGWSLVSIGICNIKIRGVHNFKEEVLIIIGCMIGIICTLAFITGNVRFV